VLTDTLLLLLSRFALMTNEAKQQQTISTVLFSLFTALRMLPSVSATHRQALVSLQILFIRKLAETLQWLNSIADTQQHTELLYYMA